MKCSAQGVQFIKSYEKLRLKAYTATQNEHQRGIWTIGWGHTKGVKQGDTCTIKQAEDHFLADLREFEDGVNLLVTVPMTQDMFDALVSFAFNVGLDRDEDTKAEGLGDSTLLRLLNEGRYTDAAAEFPKWNKQAGKVLRGLTDRRLKEQATFSRTSVVVGQV